MSPTLQALMRWLVVSMIVPLISPTQASRAATNFTYPSSVAYWYLFANDGGVQAKLNTATFKLQDFNFAGCFGVSDNRACVTLTQSGSSIPTTQLSSDITNSTELAQAKAVPQNIKVVNNITFCDGMSGAFTGCTVLGERNIIIERSATAGDFAHEFGHAQGIPTEDTSCQDRVMYFQAGFNSDILVASEVTAFTTPHGDYFNGVPCVAPPVSASTSFFVPQSGSYSTPTEGTNATRFFRGCPNNDGTSSYPSNARIKVEVRDINNSPIAGIAAGDVYLLFNGGTPAQGFSGVGADSVIANSAYNFYPVICPNVQKVMADGPTNSAGVTYITFGGAGGGSFRDPSRRWGHYDTEIPVFVAGVKVSGKLTSGSAIGSYTLQIKNIDWWGGLLGSHPADDNVGEQVDPADFNGIANGIGDTGPLSFWKDLDWENGVDASDFNIVTNHASHNCQNPNP